MSNPDNRKSWLSRRRGLASIAAGAVVLAVVVVGILLSAGSDGGSLANVPTFKVEQGPLLISISESGTITARDQVVVKSEVEGRPTIIYLIDEGVHVEPGDLLVELDSSGLQSDLVDQEIKVQNAEAAMIQAQEELAVAQNQAEADIAQAKLDYEFAKQDLQKYVEGDYPMLLKEADTEIQLKREALEQAAETLKWSEDLFKQKYISLNELESDRTAHSRAKLEYELALQAKEVLTQYTYHRDMATYESAVEQMKMALERTLRSAKASLVQAEANARAKQAEYNREVQKKQKLEDQIAKCRMTAPVAGMVVYATTGRGSWRGNAEPLEEGQEVRERQELIYLPTASAMQAEIKIHESSLDKVAVGMPVRITVDALPGRTFSGRVSKISPLPDAQSIWLNPDLKVYSTQIDLDGELKDVRTGMTCRAEVLIDHYNDAIYVPVQSVVRVGNQPTVYVREGDEFVPRPVDLGLSNNRMVRVIDGVRPGELVSLAPPLAPAAAEDEAFAAAPPEALTETASAKATDATATPTVTPAANAAPAPEAETAQTDAAPQAESAAPAEGRRRMGNLTPEQREQFRQRMQNMTPEERQKLREQRRRAEAPAAEAGS